MENTSRRSFLKAALVAAGAGTNRSFIIWRKIRRS
ncbi:MAG: twin-arginine translocation signal domain-containing protein [Terriglobia bacterium]